jgi:hypothetical protein
MMLNCYVAALHVPIGTSLEPKRSLGGPHKIKAFLKGVIILLWVEGFLKHNYFVKLHLEVSLN